MTSDDEPLSFFPLSLALRSRHAPPVAQVRRWVSTILGHLAEVHRTDVVLVTNALATNVYRHTAGIGCVRLAFARAPCRVHIEVDDNSPITPLPSDPRFEPRHRFGLIIASTTALDWGVRRIDRGGKTLWAVIGRGRSACGPRIG